MMNAVFFWEYIKNVRTVGAVLPSSRFLARKVADGVNFDTAKIVVQFGPGTGSFTRELIARRKPHTTLLLIEKNKEFCRQLEAKFGQEKNLIIVNDSAENLTGLLKQYGLPSRVDCIVSGLPFASLPADISQKILIMARKHTKSGCFITFQYTLLKRSLFEHYFNSIEITREFRNIPPAYVLRAHN